MRKIVSKEEEKKKQKKRQTYLVFFLVLILFFSLFGVMVNSFGEKDTSSKISYNGLDFFKSNNYWVLNLDNLQLIFKHSPKEIENYNIEVSNEINSFDTYSNKPLYIYSEDYEAKKEILNNLGNFALRIQEACPEETLLNKTFECNPESPIKNCNDNFVIILNGENKIQQQENCVIISSQENITKTTDAFLYKTLGII